MNKYKSVREKKILEQLSGTRFLRDLKIPPFFPCYAAAKKRAGKSITVKYCVLESFSDIFFTLDKSKFQLILRLNI